MSLNYLVYSTLHWKRLVNAYAGIEPSPYLELLAAVRRFPSEAAIDALRRRDVRFVVVHRKGYGPPKWARSSATSRCSPARSARWSASTATPCTS